MSPTSVRSEYFTVPNYISLFRLIITFAILWLWFSEEIFTDEIARLLVLVALFVIGALSDMVDGYWARKFKEKTKVGAFLDSLVDKFFTLSFFVVYLYIDFLKVAWFLIVLIVIREIYITAIRIYISMSNQVMVTEKHGKWKFVLQVIFQGIMWLYLFLYSIIFETRIFQEYLASNGLSGAGMYDLQFTIYASFFLSELGIKQFWIDFLELSPNYMLSVVTFYTVYSGINYILKNRRTPQA